MIGTIAPPQEKLVTGEELYHMPDSDLCELIEGRIVMQDATGDEHGGIEVNVTESLNSFVRPRKLGKVRGGEVGTYISVNGGLCVPWRVNTTATSAAFTAGATYAFYSVARGGAGNVEDAPATADATTKGPNLLYLPIIRR